MEKAEARKLLATELSKYHEKSYEDLTEYTDGRVDAYSITTAAGKEYQIEIQVFWDGKSGGDIRVSGAIDDGGIRAFIPLSVSFVMSPDGTCIDE